MKGNTFANFRPLPPYNCIPSYVTLMIVGRTVFFINQSQFTWTDQFHKYKFFCKCGTPTKRGVIAISFQPLLNERGYGSATHMRHAGWMWHQKKLHSTDGQIGTSDERTSFISLIMTCGNLTYMNAVPCICALLFVRNASSQDAC